MMLSLLKTLPSVASMGLFPYTVSTAFTDYCWVQGHIYESLLSSPEHQWDVHASNLRWLHISAHRSPAEVRSGELSSEEVWSWCLNQLVLSLLLNFPLCTRTTRGAQNLSPAFPSKLPVPHTCCTNGTKTTAPTTSSILYGWVYPPLGSSIYSNEVIPV